MYSLPRATDIAESMCACVIDVDSTVYAAFRVQTLMFVWMVKEEGVSILVSDSGHQGDTPKLSSRAYVPSEDSRL